MKRDCPHCHKSMEGEFIRWLKFEKANAHRNCPLCGGEIEIDMHPEEIGVRVFTIVALVAAAYFANKGEHGFLKPLAIGVGLVVIAHVAVLFLMRNRQRFRKGRHAR